MIYTNENWKPPVTYCEPNEVKVQKMNKEEAIDCLNGTKIYLQGEHIDTEAIDMAIEALQAEPTNKSGELFITLNKAVEVAVNQFDIDRVLARQEFEQKCYVPCSDYEKGFYDGLAKCRDIIEDAMNEGLYERATENMEHNIRYEPTYNQDDGSM